MCGTYIPDKRHCERVVEALNLQHLKAMVTPAVRESESVDGESIRECSWESMRALESQSKKASMHDVLDADKTSLYRSTVARLNYWAVDRPDIQYAVRVCPSPRRAQESMAGRDPSVWQDT